MTTPLLSVSDLKTIYKLKKGELRAVDGVSFTLAQGEALGVVGESGCGKSSLGRTVLGLEQASSGKIVFDGAELQNLSRSQWHPWTRRLQIVFQDPGAALNPRKSVGDILAEPLSVHKIGNKRSRMARVQELLQLVGLPPEAASRHPHEFSGGQRQRICIARALALKPDLIVCDESVSALDLSVQAQILNLLVQLQRDMGVAFLFISHDLNVVQYMCSRVIVMYLGRVIEMAPTTTLWTQPLHPYTRLLLASIPGDAPIAIDAEAEKAAANDIPSVLNLAGGCRFSNRCPMARDICKTHEPELRLAPNGAQVACHAVFDQQLWPDFPAPSQQTATVNT